ncbi:protein-export chaperone SecB [Methyloceanibacter caenitepidi]|uniref:Protein-export protein SecB n=1 Tax=Methyloceanibacter caenitepidi TaxID=1384459 RepID=A0A0A8JZD6_9HYPH|nr:protein-export chaperone SecB [Methyloceanibacter caenitepidi]BAQ15786.1 protein export cytoplasm chaperone protein [Methyloceanibacter caenitepidi]
MAKNDKQSSPKGTNGDGPAGAEGGSQAQLNVLAQYVKDFSFESPGAPQTLQGPGENPQLQVGVNVNAGPRGEDIYEAVVHLEAHAKSDAGVIYNVELDFGGLFRIKNVPENMLQPVLFVDCPTLLFPFVRRVIADVVRDGGFPPLMLDPIDFGRLYAQNLSKGGAADMSQPN